MKIPTPRSMYGQGMNAILIIALGPALLVVVVVVINRLVEALMPWSCLLPAAWVLWAGFRYVRARWK